MPFRQVIAEGMKTLRTSRGTKSFDTPGEYDGFFGRLFPRLYGGLLPGAQADWESRAGDMWLNSAASICLRWIDTSLREAPVEVGNRLPGEDPEPIQKHPLTRLLHKPNPYYTGQTLWAGTLVSWFCNGNAYWYIEKTNGGDIKALWYVPHMMVRPVPSKEKGGWIERYEYYVQGKTIYWQPDEVLHFMNGVNPRACYLGQAPLLAQAREIVADNEGSSYGASILASFGIPGLIVQPKFAGNDMAQWAAAGNMLKGNAGLIKERFKQMTGDKRGEPYISTMPVDITTLGFSPEQLALDKMRAYPESRIAGAFQIPPNVVSFICGEAMKTYSNLPESFRQAWYTCILPTSRDLCDQATNVLMPYYNEDPEEVLIYHNVSRVRALQADFNEMTKSVALLCGRPVLKGNEGRKKLGFQTVADDPSMDKVMDKSVLAQNQGTGGDRQTGDGGPAKTWTTGTFSDEDAQRIRWREAARELAGRNGH